MGWAEPARRVLSAVTAPIIGWTTNTRQPKQCSYIVRKYGALTETDVWAPDCGEGIRTDGSPIANDPTDVYMPVGPEFAGEWIRHVIANYGTAHQGGVWLSELDNEPVWWSGQHRDIHSERDSFDEDLERGIRWASAIKAADPTAMIGGPRQAGWESYYYSCIPPCRLEHAVRLEIRNAHGADFVPRYLA